MTGTREREPWYAGGLRFRCTGCGDCCTGEPGTVWVGDEEVAALCRHLGLDEETFAARYLWTPHLEGPEDRRRSLVEHDDGACVFLDEARRCTVYGARPVQCRTWPFWPENVAHPRAWDAVKAVCPGAGKGALHDRDTVEERLVELRIARRGDGRRASDG